ncbi:hypothetical protein [Streptomyces nigra]
MTGRDPRPAAAPVRLRFDRHVLGGGEVRAALLDLVVGVCCAAAG